MGPAGDQVAEISILIMLTVVVLMMLAGSPWEMGVNASGKADSRMG